MFKVDNPVIWEVRLVCNLTFRKWVLLVLKSTGFFFDLLGNFKKSGLSLIKVLKKNIFYTYLHFYRDKGSFSARRQLCNGKGASSGKIFKVGREFLSKKGVS